MTQLQRNREFSDLLFKNFFNHDSFFAPVTETKIGHPVDIYETKDGLFFEIAGSGLTKEDVDITIESDVIRVSYIKTADETVGQTNQTKIYHHRGISKKSFNLGYRVSSKFDLRMAKAEMLNGLLTIYVPYAAESKPKKITII